MPRSINCRDSNDGILSERKRQAGQATAKATESQMSVPAATIPTKRINGILCREKYIMVRIRTP